jgi:hypothetical protein
MGLRDTMRYTLSRESGAMFPYYREGTKRMHWITAWYHGNQFMGETYWAGSVGMLVQRLDGTWSVAMAGGSGWVDTAGTVFPDMFHAATLGVGHPSAHAAMRAAFPRTSPKAA